MFSAEYMPASPTNTQRPSPGPQIVLDPRHGGDVGGVPRQNPRPDRHAVARHREGDDDLGLIVAAFLAVAAPAQRRVEPPRPFLGVLVRLVDLEIGRGGIVEDQIDIEPEQIGRLEEDFALDPVRLDPASLLPLQSRIGSPPPMYIEAVPN